jgi:hypothetical protein
MQPAQLICYLSTKGFSVEIAYWLSASIADFLFPSKASRVGTGLAPVRYSTKAGCAGTSRTAALLLHISALSIISEYVVFFDDLITMKPRFLPASTAGLLLDLLSPAKVSRVGTGLAPVRRPCRMVITCIPIMAYCS